MSFINQPCGGFQTRIMEFGAIIMDEGSEEYKIMCSNEPTDQCLNTIKLVCSFSPAERDCVLCHLRGERCVV